MGFDPHNPERSSFQGTSTRSHAQSQAQNEPRLSPSNLCEPLQNFTKLTVQGSSAALDLQDLKISSQDAQPRASTRQQRPGDHQRLFTRRFRHLTRFHALDAPNADTCPLRMTSWMTSSSTTRFDKADPVWTGPTWKPEPVRTACKKKKKKN